MLRFSSPSLVVALVVAGIVLAGSPQPLQACVWSTLDGYGPLPPCEIEDKATRQRLEQANQALRENLAAIASKIITVRKEIAAWQRGISAAKRYYKALTNLHGTIELNPLPSLAAEFNRQAPLGRHVRLTASGEAVLDEKSLFDIRAIGDSILSTLATKAGVEDFVGLHGFRGSVVEMAEQKLRAQFSPALVEGKRMRQKLMGMLDARTQLNRMADTLAAVGQRTGSRYKKNSTTAGESEAQISDMSATLSALKGTAMESKVRATRMEVEATLDAIRMGNQLDTLAFRDALLEAIP